MPQLLPILLYAGCFILSLPFHAPRRVAMASPPISFSFDFTNKTSYNSQDLLVQGDARVGGSMVDLTCNTVDTSKMLNCMGRVSYGRPVPFYDTDTGEAASFNTHFTFKITLVPRRSKGDGMAFFLASYPPPSVLPPDSYGGAFGLMPGRSWQASGENRFVAVEFDTYNNTDYEPRQTMDHIGIDLNSVKDSVNTTNLPEFSLNGTMTASINFNGSSRMLVARLYFVDRPSMKPVEVSAQLPQLDTLLTPEVTVGFSAATGAGMELHQILSWSFNSTLAPKEQPKSIGLIAAAIAGGASAFLLVIWFILSWLMSKRGHNSLMVSGAGPKQFQYNDLAKATNNFSSDRKLGEGGFGAVYHGTCFKVDNDGDEHDVAVKEILKGSKEGTKAFLAELNTISRTKHKNLVKLEGWCCYRGRSRWDWMCWCCSLKQLDDHKLFLVYELMPQGDLDHHLHKKDVALTWPTRYKIVKELGSALVYLHHECEPYILHRDIKPGNILLDNHYNAKIADFGLSRIANKNKSTLVTTAIGTHEYMDPKLRIDGDVKFDRSSDVYSFGLVLLEIVCGRHNSRNEVWDLYRRYQGEEMKMVEAAADERLGGDFHKVQMQRVLVVGLWCSLPHSAQRPSMEEALRLLEHDELPDLTLSATAASTI
ncbi:L-type lectin-domain containing receptor kinase IX.1-like [Hordeum vulgare subsp. vulgare]|uniref:non-specific serine/threonine protein kinase n=1 Tax=Hordeum vulgare subsp. vulgare TaxID=112509 RepID=A0A8I6YUH7_HORVV|nr:L-type lectin-domain containing receptor kinase IX.1-like [Hordeum vulgare subsp. vulgare]